MRHAGAAAAILLSVLLAISGARADPYMLLDGDVEAAQVRVDLIAAARETIDATYFIVGKDQVTLAFLAELREASRRGVRVRFIIDAPFNAIPLEIRAALRRDGVELQEYHPFRWLKPHWLGRRMHDKLLIVDGRHLVTGGRNLEASYFGRADQKPDPNARNYVDRDAYVAGESAARAQAYFNTLWTSREVRRIKLGRFRPKSFEADCEGKRRCLERRARLTAEVDAGARRLDALYQSLNTEGGLLRRDVVEPVVFDTRDVGPITFLHDPVGKKDTADGIGTALFEMMDGTETSLLLESPWLVPSRAMRQALRRALDRGVHVRILTNSLFATDSLMTHAGYLRFKKRLARQGIELWEYAGPGCLHAKTGVFDNGLVVIGSFNLDPRSEHFNSEVAVAFEDEHAAGQARAPMDERLGQAVRIGADGRPLPGPVVLPKVPFLMRLKLAVARVIAVFVHRQL